MAQKAATPIWLHDIAAALGLLTRLPVAVDTDLAMSRSASSTWAYPIVGLILGGLSLLVFVLCQFLGLPPLLSVILIIALNIILTGAMHEDGLADSADGLWGGWSVERRLEIMKDSHIGVYGVCAIGLMILLKTAAFITLALHPLFALALFGGAALSRAKMVALMHYLPNARGSGLSQSVGRPSARAMWTSNAIAIATTLTLGLLIGHIWAAVLMIVVTSLAALVCAAIAQRKIKGQTGDILGATQQICDVAALIALSACVY